MRFFIDSADISAIETYKESGLVDGVTTNPSLVLKAGRQYDEVLKDICACIDGPVSAEVVALQADDMIKEGKKLAKIHPNIVVKIPLTADGLMACRALDGQGIKTNVTLCFSAVQALLAARAGATYISPFIGRLDDSGIEGVELLHDIRTIYDNYDLKTEILAASIRTSNHVKDAALAGADVATVPPSILAGLIKHPLTDAGLKQFMDDWKKTGQSIL